MKLIKEGKWLIPWSGEFTCRECESIFLVEEKDLEPSGNQTDSNYFQCQSCKTTNYVDIKRLPTRVKKELNNKRKYWNSGDNW
jgi:hypothetical protein